jgi:hypothetical protein
MKVAQGNSMCSSLNVIFFLHKNHRTGEWNRSSLGWLVPVAGGGGGERVWEGEYGANTVYTLCKLKNDIC